MQLYVVASPKSCVRVLASVRPSVRPWRRRRCLRSSGDTSISSDNSERARAVPQQSERGVGALLVPSLSLSVRPSVRPPSSLPSPLPSSSSSSGLAAAIKLVVRTDGRDGARRERERERERRRPRRRRQRLCFCYCSFHHRSLARSLTVCAWWDQRKSEAARGGCCRRLCSYRRWRFRHVPYPDGKECM